MIVVVVQSMLYLPVLEREREYYFFRYWFDIGLIVCIAKYAHLNLTNLSFNARFISHAPIFSYYHMHQYATYATTPTNIAVKETMVPSAVHHVVVIWMIVKFLDMMEIQAGVVAVVVAAEEEALIHVVAVMVEDTMIVVVVEDTTIHVMETLVGEGVEEQEVVVPHLDLIVVELMESLPGEEVVVAVVEWADWDQMVPLHPEEASALA